MQLPLLLGLTATQAPLPHTHQMSKPEFAFKQGHDRFSPNDFVQLGRPGQGIANDAGDLVLVSYTQFNITSKENKKSVFILPGQETTTKPLEIPLGKADQTAWLDGTNLLRVVENDGKLDLYVLPTTFQPSAGILELKRPATLIGSIPTTTATNFVYSTRDGYLIFSDYVYEDGLLTAVKEQDDAWENRGNSAFVYDTTYERHWDTWITPKRSSLFSVKLQKDPDHKYHLGSEFKNLLQGTGHATPVEPFGGTDDFDISAGQVVYTTLDPKLPPAWHTKQDVFIVDIAGTSKPRQLTSGKQGATHSPVLNGDATKAAWLELDQDGYETDRAKIVIYDLTKDVRYTLTQKWDRSPDALAFSESGKFLYFTAGDHAKVKTFVLPIPSTPKQSTTHPDLARKYYTPIPLTETAAATGLQILPYGRALITKSSYTSPNDVFLINGLHALEAEIEKTDNIVAFKGEIAQLSHFTESSLKHKQLSPGEEFWFKGAGDIDVQGWTLKPYGWEEGQTKKYPPLLFIHGGPQSAWFDQWSTRWNPNVFAGQGYFVIAINPTGSTTFGQGFTDAIRKNWGGKPFDDLRLGWKHVLEKYPEIDPDRAVGAGASWGGYAINWIQGHPEFGFNFKALFCHDGVFDASYNGYSTEELFFFNHQWGGRPWDPEAKETLAKFNPANFADKWSTPQLTVHGSKDYRLPETEGISAFHLLQERGIPSRLVIFPDENHWVLKQGNSLKWHYEVFRWFDQFAGEK